MADTLTMNSRKPVNGDAPAKPERSRGNRGVAPVPVQSLGPILRERREAMGVTLAEAEVATRIRQKYLAALESDEWDLLPGEVVGRGFLRNYATYLGLEATEMIERRRAVADESLAAVLMNTSAGSALPPERKVDYRPKDVALKDEGNDLESPRRLNLAPFYALVTLAALVLLAWWGVTQLGPQMGGWVTAAQRQIAAWQQPATPATASAPAPVSGNLLAPTAVTRQEAVVITPDAGDVQAVPPPVTDAGVVPAAPAGDNTLAVDAVATEALAPTVTPTALSLLAILATPTPQPIPTPAPAPVVLAATTTTAANLRSGPSTDYPIIAGLPEGQALTISGRNADSTWYQLADSSWIFALLVANPPAEIPIVEAPPLPPPAAVEPAAEQPPVQ